jgi:WD40 repeat protein
MGGPEVGWVLLAAEAGARCFTRCCGSECPTAHGRTTDYGLRTYLCPPHVLPHNFRYGLEAAARAAAEDDSHEEADDSRTLRSTGRRSRGRGHLPELQRFFHFHGVMHGCFSPDGRRVVTVGADRAARLWDLENGGLVACSLERSPALAADF